MDWNIERLKSASIAPRQARYHIDLDDGTITPEQKAALKWIPELTRFEAISVGDERGQAFLVPLDESGRGTAELIIKALRAYEPDDE